MADKQLQTVMSSGELTTLFLDGATTDNRVLNKLGNDALYAPKDSTNTRLTTNEDNITALDGRVSTLEGEPETVLVATSTATSQQPATVDEPIQIEFGPAQSPGLGINIAADGTLTCTETNRYLFSYRIHYGRAGSVGTSILLMRMTVNGTQVGGSVTAKIDAEETLIPMEWTFIGSLNAGDIIVAQLMRDSAGNDSGGFFSTAPTLPGWNQSPSATIQIFKV